MYIYMISFYMCMSIYVCIIFLKKVGGFLQRDALL
jgi:hypothetical protein